MDTAAWAQQQFGTARLGDARRTRRAVKLAAQLAAAPASSLPELTGAWKDAKAAYRFFSSEDVTFDALTGPHLAQTREAAARLPVAVLLHETTELDYTRGRPIEGLGAIGSTSRRGMLLHSTLAVDPANPAAPAVLGLAHQKPLYREIDPEGDVRTDQDRARRRSRLWREAIQSLGRSGDGGRFVHVGDQALGISETMQAAVEQNAPFVLRAVEDQRCAIGHQAETPDRQLFELARSWPTLGERTVRLPQTSASPGGGAQAGGGNVEMRLAAGPLTIFPAETMANGLRPVRCRGVRVWRTAASPGEAGTEWVLLTNEPVEELPDAARIAQWYALRPLVRSFHTRLKRDCAAEERQLETARRLAAMIGMLSVITVHLMQQDRPAADRAAASRLPAEPDEGRTAGDESADRLRARGRTG